ncbi:MAG: glycoside hydrolase family 5 protein [Bacteroidales bacterium]|nr:glycoside hydrolase family 5 protein [Bacteroidales bacterium]
MNKLIISALAASLLLASCGKESDPIQDEIQPGTEQPDTQTPDDAQDTDNEPENDKDKEPEKQPEPTGPKDHYGKLIQMPEMPEKDESLPQLQGKLPVWKSDGRWLVDESGNHINIHGFWQTQSPYFNGYKWGNDYNYQNSLNWNANQIDEILAKGWQMDFIRIHFDTYWMMKRNRPYPLKGEPYEYFDEKVFKQALDNLYVPLVKHCIDRGLHVVIHPGFVGPDAIEMGDGLHRVLAKVWDMVSSHPDLANNTDVMFELLNEPVHIIDARGINGAGDDSHDKALTAYMQNLIDHIRVNSQQNMLWVPGTSWQQHYAGYAKYKIEDHNFGFSVHCYPGWYGSDALEATPEYGQGSYGGGFESFRKGWDKEISVASKIAPVMVTEMDWAPKGYELSWGKSLTGEAGGPGFGANFKYLADRTENCSYIFFTAPEHLAVFDWNLAPIVTNNPAFHDEYHFLYDPEACNIQIYGWYQCYRNGRMYPDDVTSIKLGGVMNDSFILDGKMTAIVNAIDSKKVIYPLQDGYTVTSDNESVVMVDGISLIPKNEGSAAITISACGLTRQYTVTVKKFELDWAHLNPNIYANGVWNASTRTLVTGQWGFGGWRLEKPLDLTPFSKIVCVLGKDTEAGSGASFRLFDAGYWEGAVESNISSKTNEDGDYVLEIPITDNMRKADGKPFNAESVSIMGIWSNGSKKIVIKDIYWE